MPRWHGVLAETARCAQRGWTRSAGSIRTVCSSADSPLIFRQFFDMDSWTFTYLIGDRNSNKCVLVDPVIEQVKRDTRAVEKLGMDLIFCINTHCHADHITGSGLLKEAHPQAESVLGAKGNENAVADRKVKHGEVISLGLIDLHVMHTPGHTAGCHVFACHEHKFALTGDTLLIEGTGRTDFQGGSSEELYDSIHEKLFTLPDDFELYPAHDYSGRQVTTVAEEKAFNQRANLGKPEFIEHMAQLNLPYPRKIEESLPPNLHCGLYHLPARFTYEEDKQKEYDEAEGQAVQGVHQIAPEDAMRCLDEFHVLDVRDPDELAGTDPACLVPKYHNIPLADLGIESRPQVAKSQKILLVCRSGLRSQQAGRVLGMLGYTELYNLTGGGVRWARTSQEL